MQSPPGRSGADVIREEVDQMVLAEELGYLGDIKLKWVGNTTISVLGLLFNLLLVGVERRFHRREADPLKAWKLNDEDWRNEGKEEEVELVDDIATSAAAAGAKDDIDVDGDVDAKKDAKDDE